MSIFWAMFWLGFLGIPLILLLATVFTGNGSAASNTHIWVYKGSTQKVKDATVAEVWKREHPGKSWETHQSNIYIAVAIILCAGFLILLASFAGEIFTLPMDRTGLRLFWQIGAPILGGLSAAIFYGLQTLIEGYKSAFLKVLHILSVVLTAVGVIGALVLTFMKRPLPISQNWLWAPIGLMVFSLILDRILSGVRKGRATKGGGQIEDWVGDVLDMIRQYDTSKMNTLMGCAMVQLQMGELDWQIHDEKFFKKTEAILLDLVQGKPLSIDDRDIYYARDEVIKAVQTFYFYSVDKFREFEMHPRIRKAVTKS